MNMKSPLIIGIDHGYANMKTAHGHFPTGIIGSDTEPIFTRNLLTFEGRYYQIGQGHKEFSALKINDMDYYILTLAACGYELSHRQMTSAVVYLAVGLPLTWVSRQKAAFKDYLLQRDAVDFTYRGTEYHVEFAGAEVFPQGFSAVAARLREFNGINMLADIGNGTMNIMYINNHRPVEQQCFTEKYGTHQCTLAIREAVMRQYGTTLDDALVEQFLRTGTADIAYKYLATMRQAAEAYTEGIFRKLREHEYNPDLMKLHILGGGGCLVQNFARFDPSRVIIESDLCATAKGYEALAMKRLQGRATA